MQTKDSEHNVLPRTRDHTICRVCHAQCSLIVEFEDGKPVKFYGDKDNPVSKGFSCIKGRNILAYHELPSRLMTSMKRSGDSFEPIGSVDAVREIAAKLKAIVAQHGPRSFACYCGTYGFFNTAGLAFMNAFMEAIGSKMLFTAATVDQPGKMIGNALHGHWEAGCYRDPDEIDVALVIGQNPIVTIAGSFGFAPAANIVEGKKRGMRLIVCDPRRSETAKYADVFLQPYPGQDAAILACLIRIVLTEELHDKAFVESEARGIETLRSAVEAFTPENVEARSGVTAIDLKAAARMYAAGRKGLLICGTGPNMAPRGTLTEYLGRCLTTLCGHWPRAGEPIRNPGVLFKRSPLVAATTGPKPGWGFGEKLRVHNLTDTACGMPTPALADEILMPGDGQVKALLVFGGNPLLAFPDQEKVSLAMKSLELLVCLDPKISATAKLGQYVVAPKLPLEVPSVTSFNEQIGTWNLIWGYDVPYAQYTPAIQDTPHRSDLIEEWRFFFLLARHMGLVLTMKPVSQTNPQDAERYAYSLDMTRDYSNEEILEMLFSGSPVPYSEVRAKGRRGHIFPVEPIQVLPKPDGWEGRFELANTFMIDELSRVATETVSVNPAYPFLLISRRMRDHYNSTWHELNALKRQYAVNPAFMNPADMGRMELRDQDVITITSDAGEIMGVAIAAPDVRAGCVSMSHGWGVNPDEPEQPTLLGGCTSRLSSTDRDCEPYSWMARQSAIPVRLARVAPGTAS